MGSRSNGSRPSETQQSPEYLKDAKAIAVAAQHQACTTGAAVVGFDAIYSSNTATLLGSNKPDQ